MTPLHLWGRNGFGDAIYTRAVMHSATVFHDVYLSTAWPEVFADLPVRCVKPESSLYGPNVNVNRYPADFWHTLPAGTQSRNIKYVWKHLNKTNLLRQLELKADVPLVPFRFDLPPLPESPVRCEKLAVVRPVTLRKDWPNPSRNPDPAYVNRAAQLLMDRGYYVVSVANIQPGIESLVTLPPKAHMRFEQGELSPLELLALVQAATVVVGGVGWIVPACIAAKTPLVVIGGGRGGCDTPHCLLDPRMDKGLVDWILPDNFCRCTLKAHSCVKRISGFTQRFLGALKSLTVESPV